MVQILTCQYQHPIYGTLELRGVYQPFESETDAPEGAELESAVDERGQELYTWHTWQDDQGRKRHTCIHFDTRDILTMESALLHRGELAGRARPSAGLLGFIRRELGLERKVVEVNAIFELEK